jgi:hypothetical protein
MKCPKCNVDNKDTSKVCKKCGAEMKLAQDVPLWRPSWKWHGKTLMTIYAVLLVVFFLLNHFLKPYMRQIPKDITPWLKDVPKHESVG